MKLIKVLFVCLGNICRSPLAEGAARKLTRESGLINNFAFDSAATASYHVGESYDPRVAMVLKKYNAVFDHTVRQIEINDYYDFDWILGMDEENMDYLQLHQPAKATAQLALISEPWGGGRVTDPYYQDDWACEQTYIELTDLINKWINNWREID